VKTRVTVQVAGNDYTLLSDEPEEYVQKIAEEINQAIADTMASSRLSVSHAAILAALNIADKANDAVESCIHLREQVKLYLDEATTLKHDLAEARREISRLRGKKPPTG